MAYPTCMMENFQCASFPELSLSVLQYYIGLAIWHSLSYITVNDGRDGRKLAKYEFNQVECFRA